MNIFFVVNILNLIISFEGIWMFFDYDYIKDDLFCIDVLVVLSVEYYLDIDLEDEVMIVFV